MSRPQLPHTACSILLRRVVGLLADDDPEVRETIKDAVLGLLHRASRRGRLARAIADAAERLTPRTAEAEALLRASREAGPCQQTE